MEINYTEDQKKIVSLLMDITHDEEADLLCLPAIDNETGEQVLLIGGVYPDEDGSHNFFPFARCFGVDESPMASYTLSLEQIEFDDDLIEDSLEELPDQPLLDEFLTELSQENREEPSPATQDGKKNLFSVLTSWIKSVLMGR